jgi:hypothetical protein
MEKARACIFTHFNWFPVASFVTAGGSITYVRARGLRILSSRSLVHLKF